MVNAAAGIDSAETWVANTQHDEYFSAAHRVPLRVVILGAGFGGLAAAKGLANVPVEVTIIDRENHHDFQPLLYQVATATLTPADIAWPIRTLLREQSNARVLMGEVFGLDLPNRRALTTAGAFPYDVLVIATGATHAYFGHTEWQICAPGLKRIEDAIEIRRRLLIAFERAEAAGSEAERQDLTTFIVIGGGPTGVEMAGAISDMANLALSGDYRNVDPRQSRIILIEAGERLLPAFPKRLSEVARRALETKGVDVRTGSLVTNVSPECVEVAGEAIRGGAIIWAAGVAASPAADWLKAESDAAGRVKVSSDLSLPGRPDIFVIGDTALATDDAGKRVPGIAPAAKQMGRYVAQVIAARAKQWPRPSAFVYHHAGDLATIGRNSAIVHRNGVALTGFLGWLFWSSAHIYFLIGARNRIAVAFSWFWEYVTVSRRSRLITYTDEPLH